MLNTGKNNQPSSSAAKTTTTKGTTSSSTAARSTSLTTGSKPTSTSTTSANPVKTGTNTTSSSAVTKSAGITNSTNPTTKQSSSTAQNAARSTSLNRPSGPSATSGSRTVGISGSGSGSSAANPAQSRAVSTFAEQAMKAILEINANLPSLNAFFDKFDNYEGRVFNKWELVAIFEGKVPESVCSQICEQNQNEEPLMNGQCTPKFLFAKLKFASNAPPKFQSGEFLPKAQSQYAMRPTNPKLDEFVKSLIQKNDELKLGKIDQAFDSLFPKSATTRTPFEEINVDRVKQIAQKYSLSSFDLTTFNDFVSFVSFEPSKYTFTKLAFVAALRFFIAKNDSVLAKSAKITIPGLSAAVTQNAASSAVNNPAVSSSHLPSQTTVTSPTQIVQQNIKSATDLFLSRQCGTFTQNDCNNLNQNLQRALDQANAALLTPELTQKINSVKSALVLPILNNAMTATDMQNAVRDLNNEAQKLVIPYQQNTQNTTNTTTAAVNNNLGQLQSNNATSSSIAVQELINRICETLTLKSKDLVSIMPGLLVENQNGRPCFKSDQFQMKARDAFSMTEKEAFELASAFMVPGMPSFVDQVQLQNKVTQEQDKFKNAISRFGIELDEISKALRVRHTGVFKWFSTHKVQQGAGGGENVLSKHEFEKALTNLHVTALTQTQIDGLFMALDFNSSQKVAITDIESLFKANSRKTMPSVRPDEILIQILRAFNADVDFITAELTRISNENNRVCALEQAIQFFEKFPGFESRYKIDQVQVLLEIYVRGQGRIDLQDFFSQLLYIRQRENIQPILSQQGIHRVAGQSTNIGSENWSSLSGNGGLNSDSTFAGKMGGNIAQPASAPQIQEGLVEDIQKACFLRKQLVKEYFEMKASNGMLSLDQFKMALTAIGLNHWIEPTKEEVFREIQRAFSASSNYSYMNSMNSQSQSQGGLISPTDIDSAIFLCHKKNLDKIHGEMVKSVNDAFTKAQPRLMVQNLSQLFDQQIQRMQTSYMQNSAAKTCSRDDLINIFRQIDFYQNHLDAQFLCSQYIVSGQSDQLHYQKLLDDIQSQSYQQIGVQNERSDTQAICEGILKRIQIRKTTLYQYLNVEQQNIARMRGGSTSGHQFISEFDFQQIFGTQLNLVPTIFTAMQLIQLFVEIDERRQNQVSAEDIIRFITNKAQEVLAMKNSLMKKLGQEQIQLKLEKNQTYMRGRGTIPDNEFRQLLQDQCLVSALDSEFLSSYYQDYTKQVNARQFSTECHKLSGNSTVKDTQNNSSDQNADQKVKESLLKLQELIRQPNGKAVMKRFQQMQQGKSSSFVDKKEFLTLLRQTNVLSSWEINSVERKFLNPANMNQINLHDFMTQLQSLSISDTDNLNVLSDDIKQYFELLSKVLTQGEVVNRFVLLLKEKDVKSLGYLNKAMIFGCIERAYQERKVVDGLSLPPHFKDKVPEMLDSVKKNSQGFYSYRDILIYLFGKEQGQKLFLSEKNDLNSAAQIAGSQQNQSGSQAYVKPADVSRPLNHFFGSIGRKCLAGPIDIETVLKAEMGNSPKDLKLQDQAIIRSLGRLNVMLSQEERDVLTGWFRANQDSYGRVDLPTFLEALGLPAQTLQTPRQRKVPRALLTQEQLEECQKLLNMVSQDLQLQGKQIVEIVNKRRDGGKIASIQPAAFKRLLVEECTRDTSNQLKEVEKLTNLVHYLVREELGKVSLNKLLQALQMNQRDKPLAQDQTEGVKAYRATLQKQMQQKDTQEGAIPTEIIRMLHWMKSENLSINQIFQLAGQPIKAYTMKDIPSFKNCLQEKGFVTQDWDLIIPFLTPEINRSQVSLMKLEEFRRKFELSQVKISGQQRGGRGQQQQSYGNLSPTSKELLSRISVWLQENQYTTQKIHTLLDQNTDGFVDREEFIEGLAVHGIRGVTRRELAQIFDEIDLNGDQYLALNEFAIFIQGAQLTREQRIQDLPDEIIQEIERDLADLFREFDEDKSGDIDRWEIMKVMQGLGMEITEQKAADMISTVDKDNSGTIDFEEFKTLMKPKFLENILSKEDSLEDFRALFIEADQDHTGYLTADELYMVLAKQGTQVSFEELVQLMEEFDVDGDAQLDIDEFVALMNMGEELTFSSESAKNTFLKIRKSRRLNVMDFVKAFGSMPNSFVPSVIGSKWNKEKKALPSSVFKPQLDSKTMTWKDMSPVDLANLPPELQKAGNTPRLRPMQTSLGAEIFLEFAEGVPLPADSSNFKRDSVIKRVVRIGLFDASKRDFIANSVQIDAKWSAAQEDKWMFNARDTSGGNPILFRSTALACLDKTQVSVIFEFVLYIKTAVNKNNAQIFSSKEVSCGWAMTNLDTLGRDSRNFNLKLNGGSPTAEIIIADSDVNTKRTGLAGFMKAFSTKISSGLTISVKSMKNFEPETNFHLSMLPQVCLLPKRLLHFVSGYRNYAADILLRIQNIESYQKPAGNVVISSFAKVLDNPDICRVLIQLWSEDVMASSSTQQRKQVDFAVKNMELFIHKIYPVLYSDAFALNEATITQSACFDPTLEQTREKLLFTALRFGTAKANKLADKKSTLEECTSFKPFNVRETGWDAWGDSLNKENVYMANFEQIGLLDGNLANKSRLSNSVQDVLIPQLQSQENSQQRQGSHRPTLNIENVDSQEKLVTVSEKKEEQVGEKNKKSEEGKSQNSGVGGLTAEEFAKELREQNDPSRDIIVPPSKPEAQNATAPKEKEKPKLIAQ